MSEGRFHGVSVNRRYLLWVSWTTLFDWSKVHKSPSQPIKNLKTSKQTFSRGSAPPVYVGLLVIGSFDSCFIWFQDLVVFLRFSALNLKLLQDLSTELIGW